MVDLSRGGILSETARSEKVNVICRGQLAGTAALNECRWDGSKPSRATDSRGSVGSGPRSFVGSFYVRFAQHGISHFRTVTSQVIFVNYISENWIAMFFSGAADRLSRQTRLEIVSDEVR